MSKQERLDRAEGLLATLCEGLEEDGVPLPPELLDWWISYQDVVPKNLSREARPLLKSQMEGTLCKCRRGTSNSDINVLGPCPDCGRRLCVPPERECAQDTVDKLRSLRWK